MIETAGGMIPFICHVFLILFGGFFGLSFAFNKNFAKNSLGFESIEARFMGRPLGFLMIGIVLMLIATLFQIGGFNSVDEIYFFLESMFLEGFDEHHISIALDVFIRDAAFFTEKDLDNPTF